MTAILWPFRGCGTRFVIASLFNMIKISHRPKKCKGYFFIKTAQAEPSICENRQKQRKKIGLFRENSSLHKLFSRHVREFCTLFTKMNFSFETP